jgi:hypothetical protein
MIPPATLARMRELRRRLREIDDALAAHRNEVDAARAAVRLLENERRPVAAELAAIKATITHEVMTRVESGLRPAEIALVLGLTPAAVSRVIEQARASARKKKST